MMKRWLLILAACICLVQANAGAQTYPAKTVRLVLPVPAGGLQDAFARAIAQELGRTWGQSMIIDNRAGATGIIAAELVVKSPADGYTVFMTDNVTILTNHLLRSNLPYDIFRDLQPVIVLVKTSNVLVVHPDFPAKSLNELLAMARAKPGELNYGSFGIGSSPHVDTEALSNAAGIRVTHVPYKGGPAILQGLMGGQISFSLTGFSPALPLIRQGRVRALAYAGSERSPVLPDLPTISEAGVPGFESSAWFGWLLPAGVPRAIVDKIAVDASRVLAEPAFREKYVTAVGFEAVALGPAAFSELLRNDREKYAARFKGMNLKLE